MYYVYILKSLDFPDKIYIGYTSDLTERIKKHNTGRSFHTAKYRPWELITYLGFKGKHKATEFELYLKSGSGRAFLAKRLI